MKIVLEKYIIQTDALNYTLQEKSTVQDKESKNFGKETIINIGYYPNFEQIVKKILDLKIKQSEEVVLKDIATWNRLMSEYIKEVMSQIKEGIK